MANILFVDNDNYIEVSGLRNGATDAYENSASLTCTLKNSAGTNVTGQSWPLTLSYVSSSNGVYRGVLDDGLDLTAGETYYATVTGTASGLTISVTVGVKAVERRA
jgi:hypothetical protein